MKAERINDGGPAFPVNYSNEADGPTVMPTTGLTIRDYFAAKAMQGLIADRVQVCDADPPRPESIALATMHAEASYQFADAMLKARGASS